MEAAREAKARHVVYVSTVGAVPDRIYPFVRNTWLGDLVSCLVKTVEGGTGKGEAIALAGPAQISYEGVGDLVHNQLGARRQKLLLPISLAATLALLFE